MSWRWTQDGQSLTSTCAACGWTIRSTERDVLVQQRAHSWLSCQQRRAETARVVDLEQRIARALLTVDESAVTRCASRESGVRRVRLGAAKQTGQRLRR